jgi:hypothetical protein
MDCKYCDYFKMMKGLNESSGSENFICEFAGYIFPEDVEEMNMEYPCFKENQYPN